MARELTFIGLFTRRFLTQIEFQRERKPPTSRNDSEDPIFVLNEIDDIIILLKEWATVEGGIRQVSLSQGPALLNLTGDTSCPLVKPLLHIRERPGPRQSQVVQLLREIGLGVVAGHQILVASRPICPEQLVDQFLAEHLR